VLSGGIPLYTSYIGLNLNQILDYHLCRSQFVERLEAREYPLTKKTSVIFLSSTLYCTK
jgi:hypothetical protein